MPRKKYSSEFKTKIILSILQGDKELNVIASENGLNLNMVRKWKQEFLQHAYLAFGTDSERKAVQITVCYSPIKYGRLPSPTFQCCMPLCI